MNKKLFIFSVLLFLSMQLFGKGTDTIIVNNTRIEPEWVTAFPSHYSTGVIKKDNQGNILVLDQYQRTDLRNSAKLLWNTNVLSKYSTNGELLWSTNIQQNPSKQALAIDSQGNIFVLANVVNGVIQIHLTDSTFTTFYSKRNPVCVIKYNEDGKMIKPYFFSYSKNFYFGYMNIDKNDNLYISGYYHNLDETEPKH